MQFGARHQLFGGEKLELPATTCRASKQPAGVPVPADQHCPCPAPRRFEKGRVLREHSTATEVGSEMVVASTAIMLQKYGILGKQSSRPPCLAPGLA
jgi:hypothetical protein